MSLQFRSAMKLHMGVILLVLAIQLSWYSLARAQDARGSQPNIVFMMADNLGYGDVGVYGGGELRGAGAC